jgi:hypothetical protein
MFKNFLPNIKVNKKIFIPMIDTEITIDSFKSLPIYDQEEDLEGHSSSEKKKNRFSRVFEPIKRKFSKSHYLSEDEDDKN